MKSVFNIEIHKFNASNGRIYNGIDITPSLDNEYVYSTEFSPDQSKLYISGFKIWQLDISKLDSVSIALSLKFIARPKINLGAMSLAPNGKIYFTTFNSSNFLHVIDKLNLSGSKCDFKENGFYLVAKPGLVLHTSHTD